MRPPSQRPRSAMRLIRLGFALVLAALPAAALAEPPDACSLLTLEEVNAIADNQAASVQPRRSGNPTECGWLDARRAAVLVIGVREVRYAVRDEFHYEREKMEKIYRARSKEVASVGDGAFWLAANKHLMFRKGKTIVSIAFSRAKNQNEVDSAQVARLVESRLR